GLRLVPDLAQRAGLAPVLEAVVAAVGAAGRRHALDPVPGVVGVAVVFQELDHLDLLGQLERLGEAGGGVDDLPGGRHASADRGGGRGLVVVVLGVTVGGSSGRGRRGHLVVVLVLDTRDLTGGALGGRHVYSCRAVGEV